MHIGIVICEVALNQVFRASHYSINAPYACVCDAPDQPACDPLLTSSFTHKLVITGSLLATEWGDLFHLCGYVVPFRAFSTRTHFCIYEGARISQKALVVETHFLLLLCTSVHTYLVLTSLWTSKVGIGWLPLLLTFFPIFFHNLQNPL